MAKLPNLTFISTMVLGGSLYPRLYPYKVFSLAKMYLITNSTELVVKYIFGRQGKAVAF